MEISAALVVCTAICCAADRGQRQGYNVYLYELICAGKRRLHYLPRSRTSSVKHQQGRSIGKVRSKETREAEMHWVCNECGGRMELKLTICTGTVSGTHVPY